MRWVRNTTTPLISWNLTFSFRRSGWSPGCFRRLVAAAAERRNFPPESQKSNRHPPPPTSTAAPTTVALAPPSTCPVSPWRLRRQLLTVPLSLSSLRHRRLWAHWWFMIRHHLRLPVFQSIALGRRPFRLWNHFRKISMSLSFSRRWLHLRCTAALNKWSMAALLASGLPWSIRKICCPVSSIACGAKRL